MKLLNILGLSIFIIISSCIKNETCKGDNSKGSSKPYELVLDQDKLYIDMPRPSRVAYTEYDIDWHGLEIEDIVADIFDVLKSKNSTSDYVDVLVRVNYIKTDKYGNESFAYNEKSIGIWRISEIKKYKNSFFFNKRYHVDTNIKDAALGRDVIMHVNENLIESRKLAKEAKYPEVLKAEQDSVDVPMIPLGQGPDTIQTVDFTMKRKKKNHNQGR